MIKELTVLEKNKPQIEIVELEGNKTFEELGLVATEANEILNILV